MLYNMSLQLSVKHMTCRGEIKVRYVTRLSSLSSISYRTNIIHMTTYVP
jgi:hypothetical protein